MKELSKKPNKIRLYLANNLSEFSRIEHRFDDHNTTLGRIAQQITRNEKITKISQEKCGVLGKNVVEEIAELPLVHLSHLPSGSHSRVATHRTRLEFTRKADSKRRNLIRVCRENNSFVINLNISISLEAKVLVKGSSRNFPHW